MCSNEPKLMKVTPLSFWNPSKDSKQAESSFHLAAPLGGCSRDQMANVVEAPHLSQPLRRASPPGVPLSWMGWVTRETMGGGG